MNTWFFKHDLNFKTCPRVGNLIKRFKTITDSVACDKTTVPRGSVNVDSDGFCFYKTSTATVGMSEKPITFVSESGTHDVQKVKENVLKTFADMLDDGVSLLIQVSIASYALFYHK